jgi:hypothetical protein
MPKKRRKDAESPADIRTWIAKQPPDLRRGYRSTLSSLKNAYKRQNTSDVLWWHEVGTYVREFFPESRQYGSKVTELLAEELGAADDAAVKSVSNTLWQARIIAKRLTKAEAKHWAKKRNKNGKPLSAYHVHGLVAVEDKGQRKKLLDRCLAESWSTQRLRAEVQNHFGKKKSRGGRTPKPREVPHPSSHCRTSSCMLANGWPITRFGLLARGRRLGVWRKGSRRRSCTKSWGRPLMR